MTTNETPRTDAVTLDIKGDAYMKPVREYGDYVPTDFARQLERELNTTIKERDELLDHNSKLTAMLINCFEHLGSEIMHKTLNQSAEDGTQALSREVAAVLDEKAKPL